MSPGLSARRAGRRALATLASAAALAAAAGRVAAQDLVCDPGDLEVRAVRFDGNARFRDAVLASAIATTPSDWTRRVGLWFGARRCLDSLELERDVIRVRSFYRQHGYYKTAVDTVVRREGDDAVAIVFRVTEGPPVRIDSVTVTGLDTLRDGTRLARRLLAFRGEVYDRVAIQAAVDSVVARLHDMGYARAEQPLRNDSISLADDRAVVRRDFLPGRIARIARIDFQLEPADSGKEVEIPEQTVRRLLSTREGDVYRERLLFQSQRDLYLLDAYQHVEIAPAPDSLQPPGDSLLVVRAHLRERDMHSVRAGVGWATLDCFRTQVRYTDRDFLGGARRMELNGRLSKIGVGAPLGRGGPLCTSDARSDPFSRRLNYYAGVTLRQPTLFGPRNVPTLSLFSERRSEFNAYERTTPIGGVASVTRELRPRTPLVGSYQFEYGRTVSDDAVFCAIFNVCNQADAARLKQSSGLAVLGLSLSRDRTDNPFSPTRGDQVRVELRHASRLIGSDARNQFNRGVAEAALFRPIGRAVLAMRVQSGVVLAAGSLRGADQFVPTQERLYGGGPNSVRGFNQNELGPVTYIVEPDTTAAGDTTGLGVLRASPTGGNTLFVANLEMRLRSPFWPELVSWVPFVDAGQVYNRGRGSFTFNETRVTPGLGVRVASPVGPFRLDVAYNGYPRRAGAAFVIDRDEGALVCVSPGAGESEGSACPETFAPAPRRTFFSRLVFHFSIGEAF